MEETLFKTYFDVLKDWGYAIPVLIFVFFFNWDD